MTPSEITTSQFHPQTEDASCHQRRPVCRTVLSQDSETPGSDRDRYIEFPLLQKTQNSTRTGSLYREQVNLHPSFDQVDERPRHEGINFLRDAGWEFQSKGCLIVKCDRFRSAHRDHPCELKTLYSGASICSVKRSQPNSAATSLQPAFHFAKEQDPKSGCEAPQPAAASLARSLIPHAPSQRANAAGIGDNYGDVVCDRFSRGIRQNFHNVMERAKISVSIMRADLSGRREHL